MQRLKLQDRRELRGPAQLVGNDIGGDFGGKRQRETHKSEDTNDEGRTVNIRRGAFAGGPSLVDMRLILDERTRNRRHSRRVAEAGARRLQGMPDVARSRSPG